MKIKNIYIPLLLLLLGACSDEITLTDEVEMTDTGSGRLAIRVTDDETTTRVSRDGATTTFSDGDLIGCVICKKDENGDYSLAYNSAWKYNSSTTFLTIDTLYTPTTTTTTDGNSTTTYTTAAVTASSTTDPITYDSEGYTIVNTTDRLYLFYYYPFVSPFSTVSANAVPYNSTTADYSYTTTSYTSELQYALYTVTTTENTTNNAPPTRADDDETTETADTTWTYAGVSTIQYSASTKTDTGLGSDSTLYSYTLTFTKEESSTYDSVLVGNSYKITESTQTNSASHTVQQLLMGMPGATTDSSWQEDADNSTNASTTDYVMTQRKTWAWTAWPAYVNQNQNASSNTNAQNASDLMWASYTNGVTNYSTGSLNLQFAKKTATVELVSEEKTMSSVKIIPNSGTITLGSYFNLQTGEYVSDTENLDALTNATITSGSLTPYTITSSTDYRWLLPPQATGSTAISCTIAGTTTTINLSQFGEKLEAGHYYKVNIPKSSYYVYFASASSLGGDGTDFVSLGSEYTINSGDAPTINGTSYSYYLYQTTGGGDFGITLTLTHTMYVTFYFGTKSNDVRCKLDVTDSNGNETTYVYTDTEKVKYYSTSTSSPGAYMTIQLSAGTYTLNKASSGSERIYYIALDYYDPQLSSN